VLPRRFHRLQTVLQKRQPDLTVLLENVHKPHNLSAILRTCDAVGVFRVHVVSNEPDIPTFNSTAQGSQKWVGLQQHTSIEEAIQHLKTAQFQICAAHFSETAIDYRDVDYTRPTAVLLGTEKWGVSATATNLVDRHIIIPMFGMVQSLNVSVANAVILFEAQRQRLAAGYYQNSRLDEITYRETLFEWSYPELASHYRSQQQPYPALNETGEII
jgi:tRNA (guanosine-2'-O-)-methyltransferase